MSEIKEAVRAKTNGTQARPKETTGLAPRDERRAEKLARRTSNVALRASSPFAFIGRFADEMERLFQDIGVGQRFPTPGFFARINEEVPGSEIDWTPHIDVLEKDGKLLVRADLPGLTKDDIKVEVAGDVLTIQGERKQEKKEEREGYSYSERSYGHFYRSVPIPEGTDTTKVTAEFQNGVLEVGMPVPPRPEPQARRVEIQAKS